MLLDKEWEDLSFLSRLLTLPSESYVHQHLEHVPVHDIFIARQHCLKALAVALHTRWLTHYNRYYQPDLAYEYNQQRVGERSFKNICLRYLVETGDDAEYHRAFNQFSQANNMTDRLAALNALNHADCRQRDEALTLFYKHWQHDPLVINKWLALQATSNLPNTLNSILELMQHEAFDLHNPNNVYALLGGFSSNSPNFHDISGSGYKFLADQVLYFNKRNPQVAGRLVQPLTQWKRYGDPYGKLMKEQLERISVTSTLSSDIYEIVCKSLT